MLSRWRSESQSIYIWKVSERAIFTIQRIVRVSPEPRFVSSVSRHCASPQALTPRWFQPKHDTDDAKESAWDRNRRSIWSSGQCLFVARDRHGSQQQPTASAITLWRGKRVSHSAFSLTGDTDHSGT